MSPRKMTLPLVFGSETELGLKLFVNGRGVETYDGVREEELARWLVGDMLRLGSPTRTRRPVGELRASLFHPGNGFSAAQMRIYVDVGNHPEVASFEGPDPRLGALGTLAGQALTRRSARRLNLHLRSRYPELDVRAYVLRNNTDEKGQSYGFHENYLMPRVGLESAIELEEFAPKVAPFLAARSIIGGAGRAIGGTETTLGYELSARAHFIEDLFSSTSTRSRPAINTRDEPHGAAEDYRRLHVIIGDSVISEYQNYLVAGTTSIVNRCVQDGFGPTGYEMDEEHFAEGMREISAAVKYDGGDLRLLPATIRLVDGRHKTAMQTHRAYLRASQRWSEAQTFDTPTAAVVSDVLTMWEDTLAKLERNPLSLHRRLDYVAKWLRIEGSLRRHNAQRGLEARLDWTSARCAGIGLLFHAMDPTQSLYPRSMDRLFKGEMEYHMTHPPAGSRADARALIAGARETTSSTQWDSVTFTMSNAMKVALPHPVWPAFMHSKLRDAAPSARDMARRTAEGNVEIAQYLRRPIEAPTASENPVDESGALALEA